MDGPLAAVCDVVCSSEVRGNIMGSAGAGTQGANLMCVEHGCHRAERGEVGADAKFDVWLIQRLPAAVYDGRFIVLWR